MNYEEVVNIPPNSVVKFTQFIPDRHEKKHIDFVEEGVLFQIITPEEKLDMELIRTFYPETDEQDYPMLSYQPFYRLVLITGEDRLGRKIHKTVHLNKYFMMVGLQTVEHRENVIEVQPQIPAQILGYNTYEFGSKFKK